MTCGLQENIADIVNVGISKIVHALLVSSVQCLIESLGLTGKVKINGIYYIREVMLCNGLHLSFFGIVLVSGLRRFARHACKERHRASKQILE